MRYAILSVLLLSILSSCNRDAAAPDGSFLSPANQPDTNPMPSKEVDSDTRATTTDIEGPGEGGLDEGEKVMKLSQADLAAARRPGSRRPGATVDKTAASGTSTQQPENTGTVPAPASSGKPLLDYDRPIFAISKTPCYGDCEQYSLTLTNDRQLILNAKKHMDKKGEYRLRLNAKEYNTLISGLDSLHLDQLPDVFPRNIKMIPADVQATVLRFPDNMGGGEMKKVEVYSDAPDQLASFLQRFEAMVNRTDWVVVKP
ncbi:MAG: hypothetical protein ACI81P_002609 [Neolewinella sp.]|jgi:hypothetical protein